MHDFMTDFAPAPFLSFLLSFVILILFLTAAVLILWIAMPFSLFGIKGLMRKMITEQKETNRLLSALLEKYERKEEKGEKPPGNLP